VSADRAVAVVTLGCARNDVDSEELAGRLASAGWRLVADPADADVAVVNTCGFVDAAKKDSIDALLEIAQVRSDHGTRTRAVVAVGCLAERYGRELADSLPEADAVLGFDAYPDLAERLEGVLAGHRPDSHVPRDRRTLLPLAPVARQAPTGPAPLGVRSVATIAEPVLAVTGAPAAAAGPSPAPVVRARLGDQPWAPLKLASGCDRRCAFCAIPAFRGAFVSRPPQDVLAEARWLAEHGVREVFLVSENSTSYGKDLGDLRALEALLPRLAALPGLDRVRVSYLQPAEMRPSLVDVLTGTPGVVPYFDLSFQHAAPGVLRRMRRFGGTEPFLELLATIRERAPLAGVRSNVIVGFPGETDEDLAELERFLSAARLDAVGVFAYSDEEGTEAVGLPGHLDEDEVEHRRRRVHDLVEELMAQRSEDRIGETVTVLVEGTDPDDGTWWGRAAHQGPEVDGVTRLAGAEPRHLQVGDLVPATVEDAEGADLVANLIGPDHVAGSGRSVADAEVPA